MRKKLNDSLRWDNQQVVDQYRDTDSSISRDAKNNGFVINQDTDFETQYYITAKYIAAEVLLFKQLKDTDKIAILDRSILDILPYAAYARNISEKEYKFIVEMITHHSLMYKPDLVIYCKPINSVLTGDGFRSIDEKFQLDIDERFARLYKYYTYTLNDPLVLESDTLSNRMDIIKAKVKEIL